MALAAARALATAPSQTACLAPTSLPPPRPPELRVAAAAAPDGHSGHGLGTSIPPPSCSNTLPPSARYPRWRLVCATIPRATSCCVAATNTTANRCPPPDLVIARARRKALHASHQSGEREQCDPHIIVFLGGHAARTSIQQCSCPGKPFFFLFYRPLFLECRPAK